MSSPMVAPTLMTPHSYPIGHHSYSSVTKNGKKLFKNMFFLLMPSQGHIPHMNVLIVKQMVYSAPTTPPKVVPSCTTPHIYPTSHHGHPF